VTAATELGRIAGEFRRLSTVVEGDFPANIELRDIPDENWRRIQLGQDLNRLALAVNLLRQAIEQNDETNRLAGVIALNATTVLVYGDLVMDDLAKVRGSDSYNDMLLRLDPGASTSFRDAARRAWPLRVTRNQLLVHRNPDHTGHMEIDRASGTILLAQTPRTTEASADEQAALGTLQMLAGITVSEDDDGALKKLSEAIFARIDAFGQADRDALASAFKKTGLHSPPIVEMLGSLLQVIEGLGGAPPINPVPLRPRPPGGTLIRALGAATGSPIATRMGGHLVFIQYRVADVPASAASSAPDAPEPDGP
jgi:hypothetical protein